MCRDNLKKDYEDALGKLADMLSLDYGEIHNFCGDVEDAAFGARRLKEFFKGPDVVQALDSIVRISDEYRYLQGDDQFTAACRA